MNTRRGTMKMREIGSELEQEFRDRIFDRVNKIPIMSTMKLEVINLKAPDEHPGLSELSSFVHKWVSSLVPSVMIFRRSSG